MVCGRVTRAPRTYDSNPIINNVRPDGREDQHMTSIKPIGDRVVVKPEAAEEKTSSGLYIPDTAKEKPQRGKVLFVGPGAVQDGKKVDMTVKAGDSVLYGKYSGSEITLDGEEVLIMRENDILGVIDEK